MDMLEIISVLFQRLLAGALYCQNLLKNTRSLQVGLDTQANDQETVFTVSAV